MHRSGDPPRPPADPTLRFAGRAEGYDQHRPSYPKEAVDFVLEGLGDPSGLIAADIGAGTGISARLLAARGVRVMAIEPNRSMFDVGSARGDALIHWDLATGESTGLPDGFVDLVVCAQAFHWLDRGRALEEFHRILKPATGAGPAGRAAVLWNVQEEGDAFTRAYAGVIARHALEAPTSPSFTGNRDAPAFALPAWRDGRVQRFANAQELDRAGLVGRAESSSYCPTNATAPAAYDAMVGDLGRLFDQWAQSGGVRLVYQTWVYAAERGA